MQGNIGAQGPTGAAGDEGKRGSTGEQGSAGPVGLRGPRVSNVFVYFFSLCFLTNTLILYFWELQLMFQ